MLDYDVARLWLNKLWLRARKGQWFRKPDPNGKLCRAGPVPWHRHMCRAWAWHKHVGQVQIWHQGPGIGAKI